MQLLNRQVFFADVRRTLFKGKFQPTAVITLDAIFDEWERRGWDNLDWLAYMMATVMLETGQRFTSVREGFSASDAAAQRYINSKKYKYRTLYDGLMYYGRCLVQLTWRDNYVKMAKILGIDLVKNPDLALIPRNAVAIMFEGMSRGTFTGKSLKTYFNAKKSDPKNARQIINRMDRAAEGAEYFKKFRSALTKALAASPAHLADLPSGFNYMTVEPPHGAKSIEIEVVQRRLAAMGYFPGELDASWGRILSGAIGGFKNDRHVLPANVLITQELMDELDEAEAEGWRAPISKARSTATVEQVAEKLPETAAAVDASNKGFWGTISASTLTVIAAIKAFFGDLIGGVFEHFDDAQGWVEKVKEFLPDTAGTIWLLVICLAFAVIIYRMKGSADQSAVSSTVAYREAARL